MSLCLRELWLFSLRLVNILIKRYHSWLRFIYLIAGTVILLNRSTDNKPPIFATILENMRLCNVWLVFWTVVFRAIFLSYLYCRINNRPISPKLYQFQSRLFFGIKTDFVRKRQRQVF